ncbi:hypothetical protein AB0L25_39955 [Spirillospora sp. NPDC052242]
MPAGRARLVAGAAYLLPPLLGFGEPPDSGLATGWSAWTVAACGLLAFGPFGAALGAAAWSYQRRTRPVCVSPGTRAAGSPSAP